MRFLCPAIFVGVVGCCLTASATDLATRSDLLNNRPVVSSGGFDLRPFPAPSTDTSVLNGAESYAAVPTSAGALANTAIRYFTPMVGQHAPDWAKRIEFEIDFRRDLKPTYSLLTVQPLYQGAGKQDTIFVQGSLLRYDMLDQTRNTTNIGVGYRRLMFDNSLLLGVNAFYDHEWTNSHRRASIGGEVKWGALDFNTNWYKALSGTKAIDATTNERAMSGWDAELRAQVPYLPWMQVGARYYTWHSEWASDLRGWTYSASADITPNLAVEAGWSSDNNVSGNGFVKFVLRLARTDRPVLLSDRAVSSVAFEKRDLSAYTLDKVRRENRIIVERQSTAVGGGVIIGRGD